MDGMAQSMNALMWAALPTLRYLPVLKRVRVLLDDQPVADSRRALLVWEPRRVVPSYAVPVADVSAQLVPAAVTATRAAESAASGPPVRMGADGPPVLDPRIPFTVHTAAGEPVSVIAGGRRAEGAGIVLDDPDLEAYVTLDFDAFSWLEEDQPLVGHPRDPMHRIDVCPSSSRVRLEHDGTVLAESARARLLFEGTLPMVRYYLPRDDVTVPLLPSQTRTTCAYKGHATYWTVAADELRLPDIAWSYEAPQHDAAPVAGMISFFNERLDVVVDGRPQERVVTPWS